MSPAEHDGAVTFVHRLRVSVLSAQFVIEQMCEQLAKSAP
jgi:hypothetical protein